jgi:hypothetical protein
MVKTVGRNSFRTSLEVQSNLFYFVILSDSEESVRVYAQFYNRSFAIAQDDKFVMYSIYSPQ